MYKKKKKTKPHYTKPEQSWEYTHSNNTRSFSLSQNDMIYDEVEYLQVATKLNGIKKNAYTIIDWDSDTTKIQIRTDKTQTKFKFKTSKSKTFEKKSLDL